MANLFLVSLLLLATQNVQGMQRASVSLKEQADFAAIIFSGVVKQRIFALERVEGVLLTDIIYHKGSGPSSVAVRGFGVKSYGEMPMPVLGSRVIIFGCRSADTDFPIMINDYADFAGIRTVRDEVLTFVNTLPAQGPSGEFTYYTCKTKASSPPHSRRASPNKMGWS